MNFQILGFSTFEFKETLNLPSDQYMQCFENL